MRIRRLDLTRYGKFTDAAIDFGARIDGVPDLHLVYGLNEAGKSTALNGTLDLLFGIEERSRYGFLHPYPAMEVGACLEFDGACHDVVRRKQRSGSLTDREGRQVGEALLSGALSGLGRDAYRTMFSLDDETLEEGGNAILQSRGDLGELLFSASAGLAEIGALLAKAGEEADAIFKKRARSTEIAGLKQTLAELKTRREELDMAASAYAGLSLAAERATAGYEAAMAERGRLKAALDTAGRLLKAGPDADRYRDLARLLGAYDGLPRPPEAWARELPDLMERETATAARLEVIGERRAQLTREIDALAPDEAVLSLGEEIRGLEQAMGRYVTASADLPRRRTSLAGLEATLAGLVDRLGHTGHPDPAALLLSAPVLGTLRGLIEVRSGVEARLRTADQELAEASDAFDAARGEAGRLGARSPGDDGEDALRALDAVLRRLRRSDAAVQLQVAAARLPQARRRAEEARAALAPFGDAGEVAAVSPPDPRRLEAWRTTLADLDRRRGRLREKAREQAGEVAAATARLEALRDAAGPIEDAEAARLRQARAAAWARHAATLDAATAAAFAAALDVDDRIVEARFSRIRDLEELRQLGGALGVAQAGLRGTRALADEVDAETEALLAEIRTAVPLAAGGDLRPDAALARIEAFARLKHQALEAEAAHAEAEETVGALRQRADADRRDLVDACRALGEAPLDASLADLLERAEALLARRRAAAVEAASAAKALAEREAALGRRRQARHQAVEDLRRWQAEWSSALAGSWIDADGPVGAVREIVEALGALAPAILARDEMRHRVETMMQDQVDLARRLGAVLVRLGETPGALPPPEAGAALAARLREAERLAQARDARLAELGIEEARARGLEEDRRVVSARKAEMTALFGVETLAEVQGALERSAERGRLERQVAEAGAALAAAMRVAGPVEAVEAIAAIDREALEREAGELEARHEDLDARTRALFAEMTKAADALAAVGGDDAVARLQVERQTVLLGIEEAARRHLRLKAGTLVAEGALRAFRDRHRSTMMGRASEAFAAMTRGDYTGLSARAEKDRETLIGLPRQGGSKLATDMSKGTRFQLYLALRLAGYEEFAAARKAVPFLADDIMETFDEPRSEAVLRLLAGMARIGQVVYFTHHRHLCDIAAKVEPGVRIHAI